jgi:predicted acylesterase/phospholipase RssA
VAPIQRVRLQYLPWRGLMSLDPAAEALRGLLPQRFEDLQRDFAVGVVSSRQGGREHELLDSGSLAEAVVASAAVPVLFRPVHVPGRRAGPYIDGGVRCRIGLDLWRQHRYAQGGRPAPALVHLIGRSSPFSGNDATGDLGERLGLRA